MSNRKQTVTAKDVALAAVMGGRDNVINLHSRSGFTLKTLDGAIDLVGSGTVHGDTLASLRGFLFQPSSGVRGRKGAVIGETRTYTCQEVNDTGAFLRLPVELLGLAKGDTAYVTFLDGQIVVRPGRA